MNSLECPAFQTELEKTDDEGAVCLLEDSLNIILETTLPPIFTDYLDLLLQAGTEEQVSGSCHAQSDCLPFPEREMLEIECLHCRAGSHELLIPLERIQRIEKLDAQHERYQLEIPECVGESHFVLQMMKGQGHIYVHSLDKILWVQSEDVLWRDGQSRAPWFVGTHKSLLCRLFDPNLMASKEHA